jgi:hypothetical protein
MLEDRGQPHAGFRSGGGEGGGDLAGGDVGRHPLLLDLVTVVGDPVRDPVQGLT